MRRLIKILLGLVAAVVLIAAAFNIYVSVACSIDEPNIETPAIFGQEVTQDSCAKRLGRNWLRKNDDGLYDIYIEGNALERGAAFGKLSSDLLHAQEACFVNQLKTLIPSETQQNTLIKLIHFFNRNMADYVPEENLTEIYGVSLSCSHEFNFIGNPFSRQLNFHAAHDIGHAMQDYMLVGCTSFAAWDSACADGNLVIGRNFDFFVGEEFAKNKLVSFFNPSDGYKFAMVGWAGMTGVLSGMNEKGLTVTINAAKSSMPTSTSMPISLLARQILQYASTIQEAYTIAKKAQTFVSESILIGSAIENRAAVIEKSIEKTVLFESGSNSLVCANHYQSDAFKDDEYNIENIKNSDSPYRQKRAEELIARLTPIDLSKATSILRDTRGLGDKNIGMGNEKALNQLIAHHSVVFMPKDLKMWVSTAPYQLGKFICYDLKSAFSNTQDCNAFRADSLDVQADTLLHSEAFENFLKFRTAKKELTKKIDNGEEISDDKIHEMTVLNPNFYQAYDLAGDAFQAKGNAEQARNNWTKALSLEIPKAAEREAIKKKLED